jgi:hypothetical protein
MLYIHDWEKQVSYGNITENRAREADADVRIYVRGAHFVNEVSNVNRNYSAILATLQITSYALVATSADSVPSSNIVRITIVPIGTTFENLQWRRYQNNFTFEYSSNNIFSFAAMSADSVPSSKTNIFQNKLYTLIYCHHFRTYSRCAMFDWSDTVFRRRNVTRRCISNTVLQPRYWGSEADSPEVCRLTSYVHSRNSS